MVGDPRRVNPASGPCMLVFAWKRKRGGKGGRGESLEKRTKGALLMPRGKIR